MFQNFILFTTVFPTHNFKVDTVNFDMEMSVLMHKNPDALINGLLSAKTFFSTQYTLMSL